MHRIVWLSLGGMPALAWGQSGIEGFDGDELAARIQAEQCEVEAEEEAKRRFEQARDDAGRALTDDVVRVWREELSDPLETCLTLPVERRAPCTEQLQAFGRAVRESRVKVQGTTHDITTDCGTQTVEQEAYDEAIWMWAQRHDPEARAALLRLDEEATLAATMLQDERNLEDWKAALAAWEQEQEQQIVQAEQSRLDAQRQAEEERILAVRQAELRQQEQTWRTVRTVLIGRSDFDTAYALRADGLWANDDWAPQDELRLAFDIHQAMSSSRVGFSMRWTPIGLNLLPTGETEFFFAGMPTLMIPGIGGQLEGPYVGAGAGIGLAFPDDDVWLSFPLQAEVGYRRIFSEDWGFLVGLGFTVGQTATWIGDAWGWRGWTAGMVVTLGIATDVRRL